MTILYIERSVFIANCTSIDNISELFNLNFANFDLLLVYSIFANYFRNAYNSKYF